jgi:putative photosynthetic complex assembly protein 2
MAATTVLLVAALWGLVHTRGDTSVTGAYCAFTCALLVWAWQEVAFLLGWVTGPRRTACPPGCTGLAPLRLCAAGGAVPRAGAHRAGRGRLDLWGDGANQVGWWTFLSLWVMRQSAKLNVFLGVRNLGENFLPEHLAYLKSYFQRRPMNVLLVHQGRKRG